MSRNGVIQSFKSEWASPPVLVRKKNGGVRWCIDYRRLNNVTVKDTSPLPRIAKCLDTLSETHVMSTLDLASGYWQLQIDEADQYKTAFMGYLNTLEWASGYAMHQLLSHVLCRQCFMVCHGTLFWHTLMT